MGSKRLNPPRAVCDTNVVVSALVFSAGRLSQIRTAWAGGHLVPLVSRATVAELMRVLTYPKFHLTPDEQSELLADYLPFAETIHLPDSPLDLPNCRDPDDAKFLQLAVGARTDWLITGDPDLLELSGQVDVRILQPAEALALINADR